MEETGRATANDRDQHMARCKQRALEYADMGDTGNAMASLLQDFRSGGPAFEGSADVVVSLMFPLAMMGEFEKPGKLREFIEGFS